MNRSYPNYRKTAAKVQSQTDSVSGLVEEKYFVEGIHKQLKSLDDEKKALTEIFKSMQKAMYELREVNKGRRHGETIEGPQKESIDRTRAYEAKLVTLQKENEFCFVANEKLHSSSILKVEKNNESSKRR